MTSNRQGLRNQIAGSICLLLSTTHCIPADENLSGRVVGVHDGDSVTLLDSSNRQYKIRLEAIDAPELGQEYGKNAKKGLSDLVFGRNATVQVTGLDRYERTLGFVRVDGVNVNHAMILKGLAWHYKEYSKDPELARAEVDARARKAGLWHDWKPMAPWDWRARQRRNAAAKKATESRAVMPLSSGTSKEKPGAMFWLNTSSNKRHNRSCRYFGDSKGGRYCSGDEGKACGICGG